MFDDIEGITKSVNESLKRIPKIIRWPVVLTVFISLIFLFIIFEFILGMFASSSSTNKLTISNESKVIDDRLHDASSIKAETDPSHPWFTHNQGYYDDD